MNRLDVSILFVNQNMSYLYMKTSLLNINTNLDYQEESGELQNNMRKLDHLYVIQKYNCSRRIK